MVARLRAPVMISAQSGAWLIAHQAKAAVVPVKTPARGRSTHACPRRSARRPTLGVTTANSTAPAADTTPAVPYRPVTETISMTWAMLSMPIGIRPMKPGIANWSTPGVLSPAAYRCNPGLACWVCVIPVMLSTLEADGTTGKLQFDASTVVRFGSGAAARAGPGSGGAAAVPAGAPAAGRDQVRSPCRWGAASVFARAGTGAGALARFGPGLLRPAASRGVPEHAGWLRDPGSRPGWRGADTSSRARAWPRPGRRGPPLRRPRPTPPCGRLRLRPAWPGQLTPPGPGMGDSGGVPRRTRRGGRLRRAAR